MRAHALVVGASSDIGRAVAAELAALGHSLTLWGRDAERLRATADVCAAAGPPVGTATVDVTDLDQVRQAAAALPGPLAVVAYVAGLFDWAPAQRADAGTWARLIDVNLTAAATLTTLVLPALIDAAPSALLYIGSGAAHQAYPGNAAYVASKHGLAGLAEAVFLDVRDHDVKVSLISPGLVAAGAGLSAPAGRERPQQLLAPADVAAAARFVVTFPVRGCPTQIRLQPQRDPG
jgi:NADP-dependent 3-hydroxy acid dehydrogenase YdfG